MKRRQTFRSSESGQALLELLISVIGIVSVFLGVIFVSRLGVANIGAVLTAKYEADSSASNGIASSNIRTISRWDEGDDKMLMTADDKAISDGNDHSSSFLNALKYDDVASSNPFYDFDLTTGFNEKPYVHNVFSKSLPGTEFFSEAAELAEGSVTINDPFTDLGDSISSDTFSFITGGGRVSINENVYMPTISSGN
jgi:hypothetical protein